MNLYNHYKLHFDITQYHKLSLNDINEMIPFERELYVDMIVTKINKEKEGNQTPIENLL